MSEGAEESADRLSLPSGWAWSTLGELADVVGGVAKNSRIQTDSDFPEVPYLRVANVQREYLDLAKVTKIHVDPEVVERLRLHKGDVLLNEGGDRDKLGRGWIWEGQLEDCIHQNHVFRARAWCQEIDPYWIGRYTNSVARPWLEANASQSTNLASISISKIKQLPIPIPPAPAQRRIADVLEARLARVDATAAKLRQVLRRLDLLWSGVLDAIATGTLDNVASTSPTDRPVDSVADVTGGIQKQARRRPVENAFPFLRVANVGRGTLDLTDVHKIELFGDEITRFRLEVGDLLVVEGNGSPEQIGRAALWGGEIENCVHQNHLIRVRPSPWLRPAYLQFIWNSPLVSARLRRVANSSNGLFTLSTRKLKNLSIPVVPPADQDALVTAALQHRERIDDAKAAASSALTHTIAFRRALLADAFAGNLVPQDPADEPAEELLKRVRAEREDIEAERKAARRAARKAKAETRKPPQGDASSVTPPPPRTPTDTAITGEQTALPMEFSS